MILPDTNDFLILERIKNFQPQFDSEMLRMALPTKSFYVHGGGCSIFWLL